MLEGQPTIPEAATLAFSTRLESEFRRRQRKNPAFSLRAFARQLDLDASELSKILRSQRGVGPRLVSRVGKRLGWSDAEIDTVRAYQARLRPKPEGEPAAETETEAAKVLTEDHYEALSHWHYFAILSLLNTEDFTPRIDWVAKRLGLGRAAVTIAVNRMKRLGLLIVTKEGKWLDGTSGRTTSLGDPLKTTEARRNLQKSYLEKSREAVDHVDLAQRSHSSMVMAVDSAQLAAAREMITLFRRDLARLMGRGRKRDAVYCLNIGLFPLTNDSAQKETP